MLHSHGFKQTECSRPDITLVDVSRVDTIFDLCTVTFVTLDILCNGNYNWMSCSSQLPTWTRLFVILPNSYILLLIELNKIAGSNNTIYFILSAQKKYVCFILMSCTNKSAWFCIISISSEGEVRRLPFLGWQEFLSCRRHPASLGEVWLLPDLQWLGGHLECWPSDESHLERRIQTKSKQQ